MSANLTQGSIVRNIVVFSVPFFFSYFLQTLYGMADLFIAGQFNGADVISAVSIGSQVMHMLTVIVVGLAMGSTVLIGRAVGAGNTDRLALLTGNTVTLFVLLAAVLTAALLLCTGGIVHLMATPAESVVQTRTYLTVCFAGIPFIVAYNIIAAVFRGMGDSKSPLCFIALACAANIALDYLFIGALGMGAGGAALATVLAQALSVCVSLTASLRMKFGFRLNRRHLRPDSACLNGILGIGVPVACQDGFIQISFLLITVIANRRGMEVSAAVGIVEKIISFLFLVPSSMLSAVSAIAAQNFGAREPCRAKTTLRCGAAIAAGAGLCFALLFQPLAGPVLSLFTGDGTVAALGTQYLRSYVIDCALAGVHFAFSGYFCAAGRSILSFLHNALSIVLVRVPGAYLASRLWPDTLFPMGLAAPLGSALSSVLCVVFFLWLERKPAGAENGIG